MYTLECQMIYSYFPEWKFLCIMGLEFILINHRAALLKIINEIRISYIMMIENLLYVVVGFMVTYLSLELAWHFTACRIKDKKIKPCLYKEIKTVLTVSQRGQCRY